MTDEPDQGIDWATVNEAMARQIFEQGETFLQSQLQVALASDQRAITIAGIYSAIATAVIAGAIAYWDKTDSLAVLLAGLIGGGWMLAGVGLCVWAARATMFYFPGNHPASWYECAGDSLSECLGGEAENYQTRIDANQLALAGNAKALGWGAFFAASAPLIGAGVWLVSTFCS